MTTVATHNSLITSQLLYRTRAHFFFSFSFVLKPFSTRHRQPVLTSPTTDLTKASDMSAVITVASRHNTFSICQWSTRCRSVLFTLPPFLLEGTAFTLTVAPGASEILDRTNVVVGFSPFAPFILPSHRSKVVHDRCLDSNIVSKFF